VNDTVGGVPVAISYCPLCNTAIAFDRRLGGRVLDFGVSGLLYRSDLNVTQAVESIERECSSPEVKHLVAFVRASERGICAGIGSLEAEESESLLPKKTLRAGAASEDA
jgi:hypothetical protein